MSYIIYIIIYIYKVCRKQFASHLVPDQMYQIITPDIIFHPMQVAQRGFEPRCPAQVCQIHLSNCIRHDRVHSTYHGLNMTSNINIAKWAPLGLNSWMSGWLDGWIELIKWIKMIRWMGWMEWMEWMNWMHWMIGWLDLDGVVCAPKSPPFCPFLPVSISSISADPCRSGGARDRNQFWFGTIFLSESIVRHSCPRPTWNHFFCRLTKTNISSMNIGSSLMTIDKSEGIEILHSLWVRHSTSKCPRHRETWKVRCSMRPSMGSAWSD